MPVPEQVLNSVHAFLALTDAELPGLVEGLYLEGSVALEDFRPDTSDIDFVAVTAEPPAADTVAVLADIHERLLRRQSRPTLDGLYLTWRDLAAGPNAAPGGPTSLEGRLRANSTAGQYSPVTWHTLAEHGVVLRGPALGDIDLWTDPAALAAWQNANLDDYWAASLHRAGRLLSAPGLGSLTDYGTVWTVTGISRLHYTIATGGITSKSGAAHYAARTFPERWHRVIEEALRLRSGARSHYRNPLTRRRDVLAFGRMAIDDAHRIHGSRSTATDV